MTSLGRSLTTFRGDPKDEGPKLLPRFTKRGDPEVLLGDSGGAPPAGNMEGNGLLPEAFVLLELPEAFNGAPVFASSTNDLT